jgi:hypothetical protein
MCRRVVAQTGSAFAWGARGRQFKSAQPDQTSKESSLKTFLFLNPLTLSTSNNLKGGAFLKVRVICALIF